MPKAKKTKLTIEFESKIAAEQFSDWLSGQGEQDYWEWMRVREREIRGNITAVSFNYSSKLNVKATCGRITVEIAQCKDF